MEKGAISISTLLTQLTKLSSLNLQLSDNLIDINGAQSIASALSKLIILTSLHLDIEYNRIEEKGATSICKALVQLINLTDLHLNLRSNNIGEEGGKQMSLALTNSQKFYELLKCKNKPNSHEINQDSDSSTLLTEITFLDWNLSNLRYGEEESSQIIIDLISLIKKMIKQIQILFNNPNIPMNFKYEKNSETR